MQAVFYGERKGNGQHRAILMTRALDDWRDLDSLLAQWPQLAAGQREGILKACGQLARTLHAAGQVHGCFYPKHIFLRERREGWQAQLIDLEKTRPLLMGMRDRLKDTEPLLRRAPPGARRTYAACWRPTSSSLATAAWSILGCNAWCVVAVKRRRVDAFV